MKRLIQLAIAIFFLLSLDACERKQVIAPSGLKLKIGVIAPLTGANKATGLSGLDGIKVAKQLQPYLDNGDEIELVIENTQSDPIIAIEALKKLTTVDNVSAILVTSRSETVITIAQSADNYKTPLLATIASSPKIAKHSEWISQSTFDDTFQASVAALYVRDELLMDKVAVFNYPTDPHFNHLSKEFIRKFESVGGKITDNIQITETTENHEEILKKVRKNNPTLLYVPVETKQVLRIAKHVRELNWNPVIMGSDGMLAKVLTDHKDELHLVNDMLAPDLYYYDMALTPYGEKLKKIVLTQDINVNSQTIISMEGYGLMINAMNRCDPPVTKKCINRKLRSTDNFQGVLGNISIDAKGKAHRPLLINSIDDGKMRFIVKVY